MIAESLECWAKTVEEFKTRTDLSEPQREVALAVAAQVVWFPPHVSSNYENDFALTFNMPTLYLDVLIDRRGYVEWFFEADLDGKPSGTAKKQAKLPAAFWARLKQIQTRDPF